MTTLSNEKIRRFELSGYGYFPMIANDVIYKGALVGLNGDGKARPFTAGDVASGFACDTYDNTGGVEGAVSVRTQQEGKVELAITGVAADDVGKAVYASDDDTFTLTESTNGFVGRIDRYLGTNLALVAFDFTRGGAGALGEIENRLETDIAGSLNKTVSALATLTDTPASADALRDELMAPTTGWKARIDKNFAELRAAVEELSDRIDTLARRSL